MPTISALICPFLSCACVPTYERRPPGLNSMFGQHSNLCPPITPFRHSCPKHHTTPLRYPGKHPHQKNRNHTHNHEDPHYILPHLCRKSLQIIPTQLPPPLQRRRARAKRHRLQPTIPNQHPAAHRLGCCEDNCRRGTIPVSLFPIFISHTY